MTWIKYDYPPYFDNTGVQRRDIPVVEVELSHGGKKIKVFALIDSGCQATNIDKAMADSLGIDLSTAERTTVGGISGSAVGFILSCDMEIKDQGPKFNTYAIFVEKLPFPVILGHRDFFNKFDIKFEKRINRFELKRVEE